MGQGMRRRCPIYWTCGLPASGRSGHPRSHGPAPRGSRPGGSGGAGLHSGQHRGSRPTHALLGSSASSRTSASSNAERSAAPSWSPWHRHSVAGELIDRLAHLGSEVIARLRSLAERDRAGSRDVARSSDRSPEAKPTPTATSTCWPCARLRPIPTNGPPRSLSSLCRYTNSLAVRVQMFDYDLEGLRRKAGPKAEAGRDFWSAVRRDAIVLTGSQLDDLIDGVQ